MNKLTPKQETFVQGLFKGLSQREAYKAAYNCQNMKDKDIDSNACQLANDTKVAQRLTELQRAVADTNIATVQEAQAFLTSVMHDTKRGDVNRIRAAELLIKAQGGFVENVNLKGDVKFNGGGLRETMEELRKG